MKVIIQFLCISLIVACQSSQDSNNNRKNVVGYDATTKSVTVYTTADSGNMRMQSMGSLSFRSLPQPVESDVYVFVDPGQEFQTYMGIGAALTDASAETFYKLPKEKQAEFLKAHFDKEQGIGYTVARTNINSCDFSSDMYTYVQDGDMELKTFDIAHDKKFKLPMIKEAMAAAGGKLSLFASPWSPPAWMKDNNDMLKGGKTKSRFIRIMGHVLHQIY
jgi:glucosylceramidase